jgi:hypothetical protein
VSKILQDLQSLLNDPMSLAALYIGDKSHAAGIMFIRWIIQPMLGWQSPWGHHKTSSSISGQSQHSAGFGQKNGSQRDKKPRHQAFIRIAATEKTAAQNRVG